MYIANPKDNSQTICCFYVALSGWKTQMGQKVLKYYMVLLAQNCIKKSFIRHNLLHPTILAAAHYEPNVLALCFQVLFGIFKQYGVMYSSTGDFNSKGDFYAVLKTKFEATQQHWPDYGTTPNAAIFDANYKVKRQQAIKSSQLDPFNVLTNSPGYSWKKSWSWIFFVDHKR